MRGRRRASKGEGGGEGEGEGIWREGLPFCLSSTPFPFPIGYHSSDINIPRPLLLSSSDVDIFLPDMINPHLIYRYPTFIVLSALSDITRNFSKDDDNGQRVCQKSNGFIKQNSNSARMYNWHTLFVHFFSVNHYIIASKDVLWRT